MIVEVVLSSLMVSQVAGEGVPHGACFEVLGEGVGHDKGHDLHHERTEPDVVEGLDVGMADGAVHPLGLAVGPGMIGLGQPMLDVVRVADHADGQVCPWLLSSPVEGRPACGTPRAGHGWERRECVMAERAALPPKDLFVLAAAVSDLDARRRADGM